MELRVLRYFLAVAEEENITSAAEKLHMTQPSLSRQMMALEKELGQQLFLRTNRRTVLTREGLHLKQRAQEILSLVEKTGTELKARPGALSGHIHLGAGETDVMRCFARAIRDITQDHPGISFTLFSGSADDIMQKLDSGVLDFGLVFSTAVSEKYSHMPIPLTNARGILMRKDSPWARENAITREMLPRMPLIMSSRADYNRSFLSEWFGGDPKRLQVAANYNLIYNAVFLVEAGVGNALCLENLVNTGPDSPLCFRPLSPASNAALTLIWKRKKQLSQAEELFLKAVREALYEK